MSIWSSITTRFNGEKEEKTISGLEVISQGTNTYPLSSIDNDTGVIENICDTIAKDISIMEFYHMNNKNKLTSKDPLNWILRNRANSLQSPSDFLYTLVYNTIKYGNGLALPKYNDETIEEVVDINGVEYTIRKFNGKKIQSIENIDVSKIEFGFGYRDYDGEVYMLWKYKKCYTYQGYYGQNKNDDFDYDEIFIYPYKDLIHIRKKGYKVLKGDFYDLFNTNIEQLIDNNISNLLNQISESGSISGILKIKAGMISNEKKIGRIKQFMKQFQSKSGIIVTDANEEFQLLNREFRSISTEDIEYNLNLVYRMFGINKNIIEGTYTNSEFQAYYSKTLEPLINKMQQEFEYKLLTRKQIENGHRIIVTRNYFIGANIGELSNFIDKAVYHGIMNSNEIRTRLGFEEIEGGDKYFSNANAVDLETQEPLKGGD